MWKFTPILKTTLWGGDRIIPFKGMKESQAHVGESWEISGVEGCESVVSEGPDAGLRLSELIDRHEASLLGKNNFLKYGNRFPLLVKILDARLDLSVQVHPDDQLARRQGFENGKNEMWYVLKGGKGVRIANGFSRTVSPDELESLLESGEIETVLNYTDVSKGEVYYIPAGRVHALGAGSMVIEVQQSSDVTYRLYDYNRCDADGKKRELHIDKARKALKYDDTDAACLNYSLRVNIPTTVLRTPHFSTNVLVAESEFMRDYSESDTFVILIAAEGEAEITCGNETQTLTRGNSLLIPASALGININPKKKITLLESYIK